MGMDKQFLESFENFYHNTPKNLLSLYTPQSVLQFNDEKFEGVESIKQYYERLFNSSTKIQFIMKHGHSLDNDTYVVTAEGTVQIETNPPMAQVFMFILKQFNGNWVIQYQYTNTVV